MSDSLLLTALAFARHGHGVVPIHWPVPGRNGRIVCSCGSDSRGRPCTRAAKHPYGKLAPSGLLSATDNRALIQSWFQRQAPQANLGVVTDRLVVIDIDPRHGGDESFRALEREHGEMPLSWRSLTGGGGEHVLFACPDGVEIASFAAEHFKPPNEPPLGPGIDIRARRGYIVTPPSRHISGRVYAWSVDHHPANVPLAIAPDWLIDRLVAKRPAQPDGSNNTEPLPSDLWSQLTRQPISEYQDMAAARICGHLLRHNCDYSLALGLLHAWNNAWCKPPLGYDEIKKIVDRIAAREAARINREL
jgi:hypothetical protein